MNVSVVYGGKLELYIGARKTMLLSSFLILSGFIGSYLSLIYKNVYILFIAYGVLYGIGIGIGYPILLIVSLRWFPDKRYYGTIGGFISCIFGGGAVIFDIIQTKLVNPNNVPLNELNIENNSIPNMFLYVGCIMFGMQLIALLLVKNPTWYQCQSQMSTDKKSETQIEFERNSLDIRQVFKLKAFWQLWFNNFFIVIVLMFMTSEWKYFALDYLEIKNDSYLSIIGSFGSLCNALGRLFWGMFYDKTKSFKASMGLHSLIITVYICTLPLIKYIVTSTEDRMILFGIWNCVLWSCLGCQYAFLPSFISTLFGNRYTAQIIGLFVLSGLPCTLLFAVLEMPYFKDLFNNSWTVYCTIFGIFALVSTLLSIIQTSKINIKRVTRTADTNYLINDKQKITKYSSIN